MAIIRDIHRRILIDDPGRSVRDIILDTAIEAGEELKRRHISIDGPGDWDNPALDSIPELHALDYADLRGADLHSLDTSASAPGSKNLILSLRGADLTRADLSGSFLFYTNLADTTLDRADLRGANLAWANLRGANLEHANAQGILLQRGSDLTDAILVYADLYAARFIDVTFKDTNLCRARLAGANLEGYDLSRDNGMCGVLLDGADLSGAFLTGSDLHGQYLRNMDLSDANLRHANLSDCDLRGADLSEAWLMHADLSDCDLSDCDLTGADLTGAVLRDANLTGADLDGATLAAPMPDTPTPGIGI